MAVKPKFKVGQTVRIIDLFVDMSDEEKRETSVHIGERGRITDVSCYGGSCWYGIDSVGIDVHEDEIGLISDWVEEWQ